MLEKLILEIIRLRLELARLLEERALSMIATQTLADHLDEQQEQLDMYEMAGELLTEMIHRLREENNQLARELDEAQECMDCMQQRLDRIADLATDPMVCPETGNVVMDFHPSDPKALPAGSLYGAPTRDDDIPF